MDSSFARNALLLAAGLGLLALAGCDPTVATEQAQPFGEGSTGQPVWGTLAPMTTGRNKALAAAVGGKIYVISGDDGAGTLINTTEEYDIATDSWTNCGGGCALLPTPVYQAAGAGQGGLVYLVGGFTNSAGSTHTNIVQVFNPAANSWSSNCAGGSCDAIPSAFQEAQVATAPTGGPMYLVGGGGAGLSNQITLFDGTQLPTNMFFASGTLSGNRSRMGAIVAGTKLYTMGGWDSGSSTNEFFEFDTSTNLFTNCGSSCPLMPINGMDARSGTSGGIIYVIGLTDNPPVNNVYSFDTTTHSWNNCGGSCPVIPTAIAGTASVQVGNDIHFFSGTTGGPPVTTHTVLHLP
jgi:hypothetical protein